MKKLTLITAIFLAVCMATLLQAKQVSLQKAQEIATIYYKHISPPSIIDYEISGITKGWDEGLLTYYTFKFLAGGFVIVAADDASIPILAYSIQGTIQDELLSPATQNWLDDYSKQIHEIVIAGHSNRKTLLQWNAILQEKFLIPTRDVDPLLTTTWGQACYFNELCPVDPSGSCGHVPTGCVATAMAQIMKYHDFPSQGVGSHSYPHPDYGVQTVDFGNTTYDWGSMPDNVTENNIQVATIMYHAGVSVDMNYGVYGSSTYIELVPNAFIDYFNYNPELQLHYQSDYTNPDDWKNLLRADLDEQLPVYYSGVGSDWGHAFVCDGYSLSDEKFHFNWGWNGSYDGWFAIGSLNPNGILLNQYNTAVFQLKPYNPNLVVRIINPISNVLINEGNSVNIEVAAEIGNPEQMKITIDGDTVATGNSNTLVFTWNTIEDEDTGSHDVKAWAITGSDTVYHQINLNVSNSWVEQSSGFQTPLRLVSYISAVDENVAWAIARDGISEWPAAIQEFTRTSDGGNTWSAGIMPDCEGLRCAMVYAFSEMKAYIPMFRNSGTKPQGIYVTTDGGTTWERQTTASFSSSYSFPDCVHFFNENDGWCMGDPIIQDGGWEFEIYTTNDAGVSWIAVPAVNKPNPLSQEYAMLSYSAVNDTIWYGTTKGRVYKSVDKGYNWIVAEVPEMDGEWINPVFRNGSHGLVHNFFGQNALMLNGPGAICETFDGGETWASVITEGTMYWTDIAYIPGTENTWVSTGGHFAFERGASYSTDGGHTWTAFSGTEGTKFRQMAWVNEDCGWAGSTNLNDSVAGIYKFTGDEAVSVYSFKKRKENDLLVFPNPFTTSTTITYKLQQPTTVQITIYNQLGEQIEIIEKKQLTGKQQVFWNANGMPSGVYFCVLKTETGIQTLKMVKLK